MARHTTARRWALALPATVVAAVAGGFALAPATALPQAGSAAEHASAAVAPAAPAGPAAPAAPAAPSAAQQTAAAVADGSTVQGSGTPAKVAVRTLALGSADRPAPGASVASIQPAGVPLAFTAAAAAAAVDATDEPRVLRRIVSGSFSAVGVTWERDPSLGKVSVAVRTRSSASAAWSTWTTAGNGENDDRNGTNAVPLDVREGPGLIWTGEAVTAEVVVTTVSGRQPVDVKVDLIDPGTVASDAAAAAVPSGDEVAQSGEVAQSDPLTPAGAPATTAVPAPTAYGNGVVKIYSRAAWGADPAYMKWTPAYAPKVNAIVVHHTATANGYTAEQVPAIIRSIYYYMAVTEKYGDVGYNVLIDRFGRVWEGRYGGLTRAVVGAHAGGFNTGTSGIGIIGDHTKVAVSAAAKEAVARYSAFKLGTAKVSPVGTTALTGGPSTKFKTKVTVTLPTIYPHQSTSSTACPGTYGLAILDWVRTRAKALVSSYKLGAVVANPVVAKPTTSTKPVAKPTKPVAKPTKPVAKPTTPKPTPTTTAKPVAAVTAPVTPALPVGATAVPAAGLTIFGAGSGHGRGLSQYGAKGAALQGLTAAQIVGFYYPGSTLTAKGNPSLRVRLSAIDNGFFALVPTTGTTVSGVVATDAKGTKVALPAKAAWRVARSGANYLIGEKVGSVWKTTYTLAAPVTFSGPKTLKLNYSTPKTDCRGGSSVTFTGSLTASVADNTAHYTANMPIDTYLQGVVASEMPSSWPAAALQAQTLAARTYATAKISSSRYYDVIDTQANQCWDGALSETAATNAAIAATAGQVLTVGGKVISAEFSSDSGGYTASGNVSYLPAKADPYTLAAASSATNWSVVLTPAQLAAADGSAGLTAVTAIQVTDRTGAGKWGGRAESIKLYGTVAGGKSTTVTVTGTQFRVNLNLKSTYIGFTK
ncbi:SpoIID/LytB domain-containing protein [Cryptosporangium phraense]|uniref:SpoIID/LytB domain-containing protein n=1 Tax=Cryptosporangium phraense TaxID=2593070 RepID=A0A545AYM6_9ACTN|nr:SpoIID/LytB domain-containing protein [Cryptosporangium phraense]TQS46447.1 SpoIID/LytB domain-containing protein [Cryptosporangium phraense]